MEESVSEIGSYGLSSGNQSLEHISLPIDDSISIKEQLKMYCKPTYKMRRVRSRGAILILVWNFLVISMLWYLGSTKYKGYLPANSIGSTIGLAFLAITIPLAGWLADACIGRYRMIYCSVLIMWGAAILESVSLVTDSLLAGYYFAKLNTVVTNVLLAFMVIGLGGFLSTVVQFGIDQLHDASTEEISAYIMWYVWTSTFPSFIMFSSKYLLLNHQYFVLFGHLFICLTLSLVLVSLFCWNNLLIKEPISQNPFKLIYKVSKYALKHRYLTSRSAFTYAEEEAIGRIDFGKSKYGGPFTTEQVEDVKTFYRLLPVIVCSGMIISGILATDCLNVYFSAQFVIPLRTKLSTNSYNNYYVVANIIPQSEALLIMLYEIFIFPIFQRCCPQVTSLHKFIIGALLQTATFLVFMIFEILSRKSYLEENGYNATVSCTFYYDQRLATKFNYNWMVIPHALMALSTLMMVIGFLEFVSAQVPYSMKGVILGVGYCSVVATTSLCTVLRIPFQQRLTIWGTGVISCGFWYTLLYIILSVFGCIVGVLIVNWYKKRKREDVLPNEHYYAERYYTNLLEHRAA